MKLNIKTRLKLCWEILTVTSGHDHTAQEKDLSTFVRGYDAGMIDGRLEVEEVICAVRPLIEYIKEGEPDLDVVLAELGEMLHRVNGTYLDGH